VEVVGEEDALALLAEEVGLAVVVVMIVVEPGAELEGADEEEPVGVVVAAVLAGVDAAPDVGAVIKLCSVALN
jgi:hypothetical protein